MDKYEIEVLDDTFERIVCGSCEYMVFLSDKSHSQYKVGNILTINCGNKSLQVTIDDLLYFDTIKDMISMLGKEKCGYKKSESIDFIEDSIVKTLNASRVEKFGLIATRISPLS